MSTSSAVAPIASLKTTQRKNIALAGPALVKLSPSLLVRLHRLYNKLSNCASKSNSKLFSNLFVTEKWSNPNDCFVGTKTVSCGRFAQRTLDSRTSFKCSPHWSPTRRHRISIPNTGHPAGHFDCDAWTLGPGGMRYRLYSRGYLWCDHPEIGAHIVVGDFGDHARWASLLHLHRYRYWQCCS